MLNIQCKKRKEKGNKKGLKDDSGTTSLHLICVPMESDEQCDV